jgi:hypothetical protein
MKKLIKLGGVALVLGLGCVHAQTTFNYQTALGVGVNDGDGNPVGDNQMVILIANESGSTGFNTLTAGSLTVGSFLDGSYQILGTTGIDGSFGTPGAFAGSVQLNYTGTYQNLQAGDQLAVVWFTNVSDTSTTLSAGQSYGLYTENDGTWQTPTIGGDAELTVPGGQDATLTSLSAVPEPGTYALIAGTAALLFAAWRRRQSRISNLA